MIRKSVPGMADRGNSVQHDLIEPPKLEPQQIPSKI